MKRTADSVLAIALAACIGLAGGKAAAATSTWEGGTLDWNTPANWNPDGVPGASDEALFTNAGLAISNIVALSAAQQIATLSFDSTTTFQIGETNAPPSCR